MLKPMLVLMMVSLSLVSAKAKAALPTENLYCLLQDGFKLEHATKGKLEGSYKDFKVSVESDSGLSESALDQVWVTVKAPSGALSLNLFYVKPGSSFTSMFVEADGNSVKLVCTREN